MYGGDPDYREYINTLSKRKEECDYNSFLDIAKKNGIAIGEKQGEKTGERNAKINTARNLKQMGLSSEQIAKATGLTLDEVKSL